MRQPALVFGCSFAAVVAVACASPGAPDVDSTAQHASASALRMLDFCGNGIDEDSDGVDRPCQTDTALGGMPSVAVLRGTAEAEELYYAEVRLVPDGDPSCPDAPAAWPSVEACVGRPTCTIQLKATVKLTEPTTGAVVSEYTLRPRQCGGGGIPNSTLFSWNAEQNHVTLAASAFGAGGNQRLTLRSTAEGTLVGSGNVGSRVGAFDLYFAGVESLR